MSTKNQNIIGTTEKCLRGRLHAGLIDLNEYWEQRFELEMQELEALRQASKDTFNKTARKLGYPEFCRD